MATKTSRMGSDGRPCSWGEREGEQGKKGPGARTGSGDACEISQTLPCSSFQKDICGFDATGLSLPLVTLISLSPAPDRHSPSPSPRWGLSAMGDYQSSRSAIVLIFARQDLERQIEKKRVRKYIRMTRRIFEVAQGVLLGSSLRSLRLRASTCLYALAKTGVHSGRGLAVYCIHH